MKPTDRIAPEPPEDDEPQLSPDEERVLQEEVERVLEAYKDFAPPKLLATMREGLERSLRTHPYPRQLLRAFAPRPEVAASGTTPVDGIPLVRDEKIGGKGSA